MSQFSVIKIKWQQHLTNTSFGYVSFVILMPLHLQALHPVEHAELHGKLRESQDRGTIEKALDTLDKVLQTQGIQVQCLTIPSEGVMVVCF